MDLTINNQLSEIATVAAFVESFGEHHALPPKVVFQLNLALEELVTNIISYGYEDHDPHAIQLTLAVKGDQIEAVLRDDAKAFNPLEEAAEPDLTLAVEDRPIGGLGVHLVKNMFDHLSYKRDSECNQLTLIKNLGSVATP